ARRVPDRVRQQVQEDALDLLGRDPYGRIGRIEPRGEAYVASPRLRVERAQTARDELPELGVVQLQREGARVDPRELEEIVHEHRQRVVLLANRRQGLVLRRQRRLQP